MLSQKTIIFNDAKTQNLASLHNEPKKINSLSISNLIRFFSLKLLMDLLGINQHVKALIM